MQDGLKAHYQPHEPHIKTKRTMRKGAFRKTEKPFFLVMVLAYGY